MVRTRGGVPAVLSAAFILSLTAAIATPGVAMAAQGGDSNRGDVWLDNVGQPAGPGHEMDPHLQCVDINLWGANMGDPMGTYIIDGWPPSGHMEQDYPPSGRATWHYSGGKQPQGMLVIPVRTLIADAVANGDTPAHQGYHFKLQLSQDPQKHKTFWVDCPAPASVGGGNTGGTTTPPSTTSTPPPTTTTPPPDDHHSAHDHQHSAHHDGHKHRIDRWGHRPGYWRRGDLPEPGRHRNGRGRPGGSGANRGGHRRPGRRTLARSDVPPGWPPCHGEAAADPSIAPLLENRPSPRAVFPFLPLHSASLGPSRRILGTPWRWLKSGS